MPWITLTIQLASEYLIVAGTMLNIAGAILNALGFREAFAIWIVSNFICGLYFYGAWQKWWKIRVAGDLSMFTMYMIFICTAVAGWIR